MSANDRMNLVALYRLLRIRRTVADLMWQARWPVIARQLAAMRQTYP